MKKQLDLLLASARGYNLLDFAAFKICLITFGAMIGSSFSGFFKKYREVLACVFAVSYAMIMVKTILGYLKEIKRAS